MAIGMKVNGKTIYSMAKVFINGVTEKNMRVSTKEAKSMESVYLPIRMGQDTMASSVKAKKLGKGSPSSENLNFNLIKRTVNS